MFWTCKAYLRRPSVSNAVQKATKGVQGRLSCNCVGAFTKARGVKKVEFEVSEFKYLEILKLFKIYHIIQKKWSGL